MVRLRARAAQAAFLLMLAAQAPQAPAEEGETGEREARGLIEGFVTGAKPLADLLVERIGLVVGEVSDMAAGKERHAESASCEDRERDWASGVLRRVLTGGLDDADQGAGAVPCGADAERTEAEGGELASADRPAKDGTGADRKRRGYELKGVDTGLIAARYHYDVGTEHVLNKDFRSAEESFDKSIDATPTAAAYRMRAAMLLNRGQVAGALDDLDRCVELEPGEVTHYITRAVTRQLRGMHEDAIADYSVALNLQPDSPRTWGNRGLAWMRIGRNERALEDLDRAVELWPGYAEGFYNRGVVRHKLEDLEGAMADYERALEIRPGWADVEHNMRLLLESIDGQAGG